MAKFYRRKRRYNRRKVYRRKAPRGYRRTGLKSLIRKTILKTSEWKYSQRRFAETVTLTHVSPLHQVSVPGTTDIVQGTAKNQRIGDQIYIHRVVIKFIVIPRGTNSLSSLGPAFLGALVYANNHGGVTDPLLSVAFAPEEFINREDAKVYVDKWWQTDTAYSVMGSMPQNAFGLHRLNIPLKRKFTYNTSEGQWNDKLFFRLVANNLPEELELDIDATWRIYYKDL